jgi:hypothetical protein
VGGSRRGHRGVVDRHCQCIKVVEGIESQAGPLEFRGFRLQAEEDQQQLIFRLTPEATNEIWTA